MPSGLQFPRVLSRMGMAITALLITSVVESSASDSVRTGGTGASLGLVQALGEAFIEANPDITIMVVPSLGSSGGIKAVAQGALEIAFSSRPLKPEEQRAGLAVTKWVTTPFVLVKNNDSLTHDITLAQLEGIYTGAVTTWPKGERIRIVVRPAAEADTRIAKEISPVMRRAIDSLLSLDGTLTAITDQDCLSMIAKIPGAVGFSTLAQVNTEKRSVSVFSYNGVAASSETLANGSYPLVKPLYMVIGPKPSAVTKQFLDFMKSGKAKALLLGLGAIPQ